MLAKQFFYSVIFSIVALQNVSAEENLCTKIVDDMVASAHLGKNHNEFDTLWVDKKTESVKELIKPLRDLNAKFSELGVRANEISAKIAKEQVKADKAIVIAKDEEWVGFRGFLDKSLIGKEKFLDRLVIKNDAALKNKIMTHESLKDFVNSNCPSSDRQVEFKETCVKAAADLAKIESDLKDKILEASKHTQQLITKHKANVAPTQATIDKLEAQKKSLRDEQEVVKVQIRRQGGAQTSPGTWFANFMANEGDGSDLKLITLQSSREAAAGVRDRIKELEKRKAELLTTVSGTSKMLENIPEEYTKYRDPGEWETQKMQDIVANPNLPSYVKEAASKKLASIKKMSTDVAVLLPIDGKLKVELDQVETELASLAPNPLVRMITRNNEIVGIHVSDPVNLTMWNGCKDVFFNSDRVRSTFSSYSIDGEKDRVKKQMIQGLLVESQRGIDSIFSKFNYSTGTIDNSNSATGIRDLNGESNLKKYLEWAQKEREASVQTTQPVKPGTVETRH